ncbi:MAG TPA: RNA polymerase sigma factor [Croceibacterium sp.]
MSALPKAAAPPYFGARRGPGTGLSETSSSAGLEAAFLAHRDRLLRFLAARGAGDAAEDLLQELWLKIAAGRTGPVASPLSYLFRAADTLMIDRYRSARQAERREHAWSEVRDGAIAGVSDAPSVERHLIGREHARLVAETLAGLGERPAAVFRRHRIDQVPQRRVAEEFGVSLSTVESDLRRAYAALAVLKERIDEA